MIDTDDARIEQAALWYARIEGAADRASLSAFEQWHADADNARAYAEIAESMRLVRGAAKNPELLALRQETIASLVVAPPSRSRWPVAAGAALAAGLAVAAWFSFQPHAAPVGHPVQTAAATPTRYATGIGQRLSVTMPDGSTATLNTNTRLQVAYDAHARRLILESGQAVFHVAKGQPLPFEVLAGGRTVTAHGTVFDVRLDRGAVAVALFEGRVSVSSGKGSAETALVPNQILTASAAGTRVAAIRSPERLTSWQTGMIVFDDEPLSAAVTEINRYVRRPLVIKDAGLSSLRISGAFQTGDTKAFVEAMQLYFPVEADGRDPARIILKTKP